MILFKGQSDILPFIGFFLGFPVNKILSFLFPKRIVRKIQHINT
jgi:hypothetical protein